MLLIPAIDMRDGKCVRLVRGDFAKATVYGEDPALWAENWESQGAEWIHLVDLDASAGSADNRRAVREIRRRVSAKLQLGGGLKSLDSIAYWLDEGVDRLILGTLIAENPELARIAASRYPGRLAAALDSSGETLKTWGWRVSASRGLWETASGLRELGIGLVIHTDVEKDGALEGPNVDLTVRVAQAAKLPAIVSGGVRHLADLLAIRQKGPGLYGVIAGKALYAGSLDYREGQRILSQEAP
ncbi:MAG: 1-(5-phosphoribosyl)-5-((5-phosphoribosylamino)methylideneamino)imidazole-4-carboxamide isomerase [Deltaproteobacteria bacterium]|jgi:phosphoribosylformimino-5-aminoimidazole carboxamide ribotide isomerase|nr:1-(5-phosphoribosyl)-5-((5-phosphoribosylamino)methylideneamino)imidazole-4-carboxamide isomerase [Deltaproteobacteria bacterium]